MQQLEQLDGGLQAAQQVIDAAAEDNAAYRHADRPRHVGCIRRRLLRPRGSYPTETAEDRLRADIEANDVRFAQPQAAPAPQAPLIAP